MRYNLVFNILGLLSKYISVMFIIPIVAAILLKESSHIPPFLITGFIALFLGYLFSLKNAQQKDIDNIKKSESLMTVFFAWIFFGLICTIPYLFYGFSFVDSCFEAISGVTTTGATVIQDFTKYPKTLFFFRSLTQWFGGMGIVVLFIAVLPKISVAGRQMFYAEAPMPTEDKATPRIRYTASWFWGIYLAYTVIETLILKKFGLDWYQAIVTSLSTIATGGFSAMPNGIADFHSLRIAICVTVFMFMAGINYILAYRCLKAKSFIPVFKSEEFRVYLGVVIFIMTALAISLVFN